MNDLWQRNQQNALLRAVANPTSLLIIALAVILTTLGVVVSLVGRAPAVWMIGLALALALVAGRFIIASRPVIERRKERYLNKEYDIAGMVSPHLRRLLSQAYAYRERFTLALADLPEPVSATLQPDISNQLENLVASIEKLARTLDALSNSVELMSDFKDVPLSIEQLELQIANADNELVRQTLEKMLARRERRAAELSRISQNMDNAEAALESAMTTLGTQYSHILMLDTRSSDKGGVQRLNAAITEQVKSLQSQCESLDQAPDAVNGTPVPQALQAEPSLRSETGSEF